LLTYIPCAPGPREFQEIVDDVKSVRSDESHVSAQRGPQVANECTRRWNENLRRGMHVLDELSHVRVIGRGQGEDGPPAQALHELRLRGGLSDLFRLDTPVRASRRPPWQTLRTPYRRRGR
jgi:hypothetical protein